MALEMKGIRFSYPGKNVLKDISLRIADGDFLGITGSTGCGKTTLAYCLNGIIPHALPGRFSGTVEVFGRDTMNMKISDISRHVGFVFQDPDWQIFNLTVREEVSYGPRNLNMSGIAKRTEKALKMVGLDESLETEPHKLSHGQKQKLCLASVLAMEPDVIVLDEPTSQLDHRSTANVYNILRKLNDEGKTIVVIEHDTDLLLEHAKSMAIMDDGRIVRHGPSGKVLGDRRMLERFGIKVPRRRER